MGGESAGATAVAGRGDEFIGSPIDREFGLDDIPVIKRLFQRGGTIPSNPVSIEKLYEAYGAAEKRHNSIRHEETEEEKEEFIALGNAIQAMGALGELRNRAPTREKRAELVATQIKIAKGAVAAARSGTLDRFDFKAEANEFKEAADELKEAAKEARGKGK
jgi:hypothetical protein